MSVVLVWIRNCYRLSDSELLHQAQLTGLPVIPVVILDEDSSHNWPVGEASQWWLHHSLSTFQASLEAIGSRLILKKGCPSQVLPQLIEQFKVSVLFYNYCYEPEERQAELEVQAIAPAGCKLQGLHTQVLSPPGQLLTQSHKPYQVFTPYWKALQQWMASSNLDKPLPPVKHLEAPERWPESLALADFKLLPTLNWADQFPKYWQPGEAGAWKQLDAFQNKTVSRYDQGRDIPGVAGTSRLSPHLHFGEISPRAIWYAFLSGQQTPFSSGQGVYRYLSEIAWRDFAYQLLVHFPETPEQPLKRQFENFPSLVTDEAGTFACWTQGKTGYPIVDAGMRELWQTGWMHNRVRMIVASFLVKHLLLPWQWGAKWFWDTLLDADLASNTLGWQWAAGCGADAAPYFRIFNPILQGQKFDPDGAYVRRWVPEITGLPDGMIHTPWQESPMGLYAAGITLGENYPEPIVEHTYARSRALKALEQMKL